MPDFDSQVSGERTRIFSKPMASTALAFSREMISFSWTITSSVTMSTMVSRAVRPVMPSVSVTLMMSPS